MERLCAQLREATATVIEEWNRLLGEGPWDRLGEDDRIDNLPEVVLGLVEASLCQPHDTDAHRRHVLAAVHHGEVRRGQGFTEEDLFGEYDVLRKAFWHRIRAIESEAERATMGILRIDLALTVATHASLRGFFRTEIEATADWAAEIDELVASSPFLRGFR